MKHHKGELFSLDVLALALLTCLLASVVGMLVMGEDGKAVQRRLEIHRDTTRLSARIEQAQTTMRQLVGNAGGSMDADFELRNAQAEAGKLDSMLADLKRGGQDPSGDADADRSKMAAATVELKRLRQELAMLEQDRVPNGGPGIHQIVGTYRGRYILIECVRDAVIVYPSEVKIACKVNGASKSEKDGFETNLKFLMDHITEAGFVVFVVRPAGWYENSYDALYPRISKRLAELETRGGAHVGICKFPLDAGKPITPYLPARPQVSPAPPKGTPVRNDANPFAKPSSNI